MGRKCCFVKEKPDCISSMRTLFIISKLFACNLFYLPPDRYSTEPIQMKTIDYVIAPLYAILCVVFVLSFFGEMVFVRANSLPSGNIVIIYLVRTIFYFILISNFSTYIMESWNRRKIWRLFTMLYDFDEQANSLGIKIVNTNMVFVIYVVRLILMQSTMILICAALTYFKPEDYWLSLQFYVSYTMMDGCYTTTFCVYNFFIFSFSDRFEKINDALRNLLNIQNGSTARMQLDIKSQIPQNRSTVKKLANLYNVLTECMRLHSECYSVQIAVIVAVVFQFTLVCFYMIYQIFHAYDTSTILVTFAYSTTTFYFYSQIPFAMKYGTMLSTEAKYTSHILNKGLNLPLNKSTLNQLQQFLQQISHSNTSVSCGLFSIDWTLFHTMIAAVVSYQVLFVQFDNLHTTT